jgi:hypothetical protein
MLSTADQLRARLSDRFRRTGQFIWGDGTASGFSLSGFPIPSGAGSASVGVVVGAGLVTATGGTAWDYTHGTLYFNTALSAGSAALVDYHWSVLSDDEIGTITAMQSTLDAMTLEGLQWIVMDYARLKRWSMAQGPSVDPGGAQKALLELLEFYRKRVEDGAGPALEGGIEAWSEYQQGGGVAGALDRW